MAPRCSSSFSLFLLNPTTPWTLANLTMSPSKADLQYNCTLQDPSLDSTSFHIRTDLSAHPVTKYILPLSSGNRGFHAMLFTSPTNSLTVTKHFPVCTSQTLTVLSQLPVATRRLLGEKAMAVTAFLCPVAPASSYMVWPEATSQILAVPSRLPEASFLPSDVNDTDSTALPCPFRSRSNRPSRACQSLMLLSPLPEAK